MQIAPRLAHVGDAHVAQLGAALVHRLANVLEALVAALLHLLNRLVDIGNLLLSAHDLFLLILFVNARAETKSCRRQGPRWYERPPAAQRPAHLPNGQTFRCSQLNQKQMRKLREPQK